MLSSQLFQVVLFSVVLTGSLLGNSLLLFLLYRSNNLHRSASTNLILNSAAADLITALINTPLALDYLFYQTGNLNGTVAPVAVNSAITFTLMLTLHSKLTVMADHLFIVKFPVPYQNLNTVKMARLGIASIWLSTLLMSSVLYALRLSKTSSTESLSPFEYMKKQHRDNGKYFVFTTTFVIFVALTCLCVMIQLELKKRLTKKDETQESEDCLNSIRRLQLRAKADKSAYACRTVYLAIVVYTVCFIPMMLKSLFLVAGFDFAHEISLITQASITILCSQLSVLLNPVIFIWRSTKFRRATLLMIRKVICGHGLYHKRLVKPQ